MPRPCKARCVAHIPGVAVFKPAGVPARELKSVEIHLDELEALRLVDGEGMDQSEAAESMKVSRATVGRILNRVRTKVARALVQGDALYIEQGTAPIHHAKGLRRGSKQKTGPEGKRSTS